MQTAPIVTLTANPALDKSVSVDRVEPERKLRCSNPTFEAGGGGLNVARAIGRLGGTARAVWASGGGVGERIGRILDEEGLNHVPVPVREMTRMNFTAFEVSSKRQYRFNMPGPAIDTEEMERILSALEAEDAEYVVASGSLPPGLPEDFYQRLGGRVNRKGRRFIVDTSGPAFRRALDEHAFLVKPNMNELRALVGRNLQDTADVRAAARRIVDEGRAEVVVVSLGAGGALVVTRDFDRHLNSPTVPIESKIGAGDSMVAGMVLSLARGASVLDAARYGVAAGAAAVMTPGTQLCRKEDTDRLFPQVN